MLLVGLLLVGCGKKEEKAITIEEVDESQEEVEETQKEVVRPVVAVNVTGGVLFFDKDFNLFSSKEFNTDYYYIEGKDMYYLNIENKEYKIYKYDIYEKTEEYVISIPSEIKLDGTIVFRIENNYLYFGKVFSTIYVMNMDNNEIVDLKVNLRGLFDVYNHSIYYKSGGMLTAFNLNTLESDIIAKFVEIYDWDSESILFYNSDGLQIYNIVDKTIKKVYSNKNKYGDIKYGYAKLYNNEAYGLFGHDLYDLSNDKKLYTYENESDTIFDFMMVSDSKVVFLVKNEKGHKSLLVDLKKKEIQEIDNYKYSKNGTYHFQASYIYE